MTEADIPLRDQIAEIVYYETLPFADESSQLLAEGAGEAVADALLAKFDIRPRGSLPVNEEPQ